MTPLIEIKFGSHLYGTDTPASDLDFKGVHLPDARSILLQRVKSVAVENTNQDQRSKNSADDIDRESFTLQRFLGLAAEGQTVALDVLFAPEWSWTIEASPLWREVVANRHRLLTRKHASFVGYCRTQANKYGIRGSRVADSRAALALLTIAMGRLGTTAKLEDITEAVETLTANSENMILLMIENQAGGSIRHWSVCGRKMPFSASIKNAHQIMERVVAEYGHRALAAEANKGVDWKAVSHAVRIARQALELLNTGMVTFPRPEAEHLLAIKLGTLPYRQVAAELDALLPEIETAANNSSLPESADVQWIDDFVADAHMDVITKEHDVK